MAKKIINTKPATELELHFEDGKIIYVMFNTETFSNINSIDGGMAALSNGKSITEQCAIVIYAGALIKDPNFTLEEARVLVSELSIETVTEIFGEFIENAGLAKNGVQSELQKKLMAQFLSILK